MKFKRLLAMAAALCMTTAMFAACGSDDDTADNNSTAPAETTADGTEDGEGEGDAEAEESAEDGDAEASADSTADESEEETADTETTGGDDLGDYIDEYTGLVCEIPSEDYEQVNTFEGYDAFLMFADQDWMWSNFNGHGYEGENAFGIDADITGDGEYTVAVTVDSIWKDQQSDAINEQVVFDGDYVLPAQGAVVFCVDITGICDGTTTWEGEELKKNSLKEGEDANVNKKTAGKYTGQEINVQVTSIKADGEEVEFDPSKIYYGNIEDDNNCYRIEIANDYGLTKGDFPIDTKSLMFAKSLEVTFTIEGLDQE